MDLFRIKNKTINYTLILYGLGIVGLVNVIISGVVVSDKIKTNAIFRRDGVDDSDPDPPFVAILFFLLSLLFFLGMVVPMLLYVH
jgi:hypothetical protein